MEQEYLAYPFDLFAAQQEEELPSDPLARPDLPDLDAEADEMPAWAPEVPAESCACCGADNPMGTEVCPLCGWGSDAAAENAPDTPSEVNHGLSLADAQMNFRTFGICDPQILREIWEEQQNASGQYADDGQYGV